MAGNTNLIGRLLFQLWGMVSLFIELGGHNKNLCRTIAYAVPATLASLFNYFYGASFFGRGFIFSQFFHPPAIYLSVEEDIAPYIKNLTV